MGDPGLGKKYDGVDKIECPVCRTGSTSSAIGPRAGVRIDRRCWVYQPEGLEAGPRGQRDPVDAVGVRAI